MHTTSFKLFAVVVAGTGLLLGCQGAALRDESDAQGAGQPPSSPAHTFYVSRLGDGSDGKGWATAWSELDRIDWQRIQPGDLILIDGGEGSMTYERPLVFGKSGVSGRPIVIRVATEEGHNGQAIIHGGRTGLLPECGATAFDRQPEGEVRRVGIDTHGQSWVYLDGSKWNGLQVTAHAVVGIEVSKTSEHLTFRHVELVDNGSAAWRSDGSWYPFGAGALLAGDRVLFERAQVHDNGGDGLKVEGGLSNFVLRRSWLYNARAHSKEAQEPFNWCAQPDGVRVAPVGGDMSGFTVETSIVGPGWANGLLLADAKVLGDWGVFHDVYVHNSLFLSHHGATSASNIMAMQPPGHAPRNWKLAEVTSLRDAGAKFANVAVRGKGVVVEKSLFVGGTTVALEEPQATGSCVSTDVEASLGEVGDPLFDDDDFPGVGADFAGVDLAFDARSPCLGVGSAITSVDVLLSDRELNEGPRIIPNVPPQVTFLSPTDGMAPIADEPIAVTAAAEDVDGTVMKVEFYADGALIGDVDFAPYTLSWRPPNGTSTLTARAYDEDGGVSETTVTVTTTEKPRVEIEAEDMVLSNGMTAANGCISHATTTTGSPTAGGKATYDFTVPADGTYSVRGWASAPSGSENSFFLNIDAEPVAGAIWDLVISTTVVEQPLTWRGAGTDTAPEFSPKTFNLTAGTHTIVVRGREAGSCLDRLVIELAQ